METTEEIWDEQLTLNLKGYFFMVKALVPHWRERGGGKVINISSIAGIGAFPNCPAYCASKGGVVNLTRALAVELGKEKININAIAPDNVATPLNAHVRKDPEWVAMMERLTPTGIGFLDPQDLTGAAVPRHGYETGGCACYAANFDPVAASGSRPFCSALI